MRHFQYALYKNNLYDIFLSNFFTIKFTFITCNLRSTVIIISSLYISWYFLCAFIHLSIVTPSLWKLVEYALRGCNNFNYINTLIKRPTLNIQMICFINSVHQYIIINWMFLNVRKHKLNWKLFLIEKTQGGVVFSIMKNRFYWNLWI